MNIKFINKHINKKIGKITYWFTVNKKEYGLVDYKDGYALVDEIGKEIPGDDEIFHALVKYIEKSN